jgi:zinc/manganese transport system substrate-binding protein/manganese/iron transport system substrate-binding protein
MLTIIINRPTVEHMNRAVRRARTPLTVASVAVAVSLTLTGCATQGSGDAGDSGVSIVATTTQVADFTRELVGDTAEVTQLVQPDQSAHAFDPSAKQLLALSQADALVVNGAGLESWLDDTITASGFDGELIVASDGIELAGEAHDHADGAAAGDESPAADDHESGDPHVWTDPANAMSMVQNIAIGLEGVDGVDAEVVSSNETAYLGRLEALDAWIRENIDAVPADERLLVSNHDAFTYFTAAYGITFVGSIIPSFDDNAEPSAAEIDALVSAIRETGVKAVFSEASLSPRAAETIAKETGVAVYSGDDALYADSLGPAGSDGATYLGSQVHNVRRILESWGATPTELPATLQ